MTSVLIKALMWGIRLVDIAVTAQNGTSLRLAQTYLREKP